MPVNSEKTKQIMVSISEEEAERMSEFAMNENCSLANWVVTAALQKLEETD